MNVLQATKSLTIAAALGLGTMSSGASAAIISGLLQPGINQFQDTDAERVIDAQGNVKTSGDFVVGDTIQAILRYSDVNGGMISDSLPSPYQLTAYAELQVGTITDVGGGRVLLDFTPTGNLGANVFAQLFERTSAAQPSFDITVDPATGIANVQGQTEIATIGIGEGDDFWQATTPLDIGTVASAQAGSPQQALGEAGLTFLSADFAFTPNGMFSPVDGNFHDTVLTASAYALDVNANTGWLVSSNTENRFVQSVPEPGTVALFGLGLFAVGGVMRRRGRRS